MFLDGKMGACHGNMRERESEVLLTFSTVAASDMSDNRSNPSVSDADLNGNNEALLLLKSVSPKGQKCHACLPAPFPET
jgi:hypothetical protein